MLVTLKEILEIADKKGVAVGSFNKEYAQFHDILVDAIAAMKENVMAAIKVFANL